ncbi:MAG: hypothetical protein V4760_14880 [Bdellovibrionota bacterium]
MKIMITALLLVAVSTVASARENCENLALKAATAISKINKDERPDVDVTNLKDSASEQLVEVEFSVNEGEAYIAYEVTVERNPSPVEANQTCERITKIEMTREE